MESFLAAMRGSDGQGQLIEDPPNSGLYIPDTSQTEG